MNIRLLRTISTDSGKGPGMGFSLFLLEGSRVQGASPASSSVVENWTPTT